MRSVDKSNKKGGHSNMGICRDITINISEKKNYNTSVKVVLKKHSIGYDIINTAQSTS